MSEQRASLELNEVKVDFDLEGGRFDVQVGAFALRGVKAGFEHSGGALTGEQLKWERSDAGDGALTVTGSGGGLSLALAFTIRTDPEHAKTSALRLAASLSGDHPFPLERIVILEGEGGPAPDWMFVTERRGGSIGTFAGATDREFSSQSVTCWTNGGETLFFTFPLRQPLPCTLRGRTEGGQVRELLIDCNVGLDEIAPSVAAPPLTLCVTDAPHDFLEAYADAQRTDDMRPVGRSPIAWNSWDYILDLVSEDYVLKHLDFIDADPVLKEGIEYIVIDCGWQHVFGEWEPNHRFPHGMEWLAQRIIERGYKAGIWFCPIVFENCSDMAYWNDHLAATGKAGYACKAWECMRRIGLVLDIMNPEARKWMHDLFARYRKMGYTYFKLDFLQHITNAYYYNGKRVPKGDLVREVILTIRDAVGEDAHIMGCNYPSESGGGTIDSCRVSGDVRPRWAFIKRNALSTAAKYWMHGRLWVNDPDFAICRGHETSDDPDLERMHNMNVFTEPEDEDVTLPVMSMTVPEARTLLSVAILSGGSITLSDNLPMLNEVGVDLLRKTVAAEIGRAARPLDLFVAENPSLWVQHLDSGGARIGVINWTDEPVTRTVDAGGLSGKDAPVAREFWSGEEIALSGGRVELELAPHETKLLVL